MRKRVMPIVFLLSLAMTSVGAGCTKTNEASKAPGASTSAQGSQSPQASASPQASNGKFNPPVELSTVMFNYNYPKFGPGEDLNNNRWTQYIEDKYGIKVKTLWDVASAQYEQKTNLMIASGDIPDFFAVTPLQFKQLYNAGLIEDLSKVYDQYASPSIKKVIDDAGPDVLNSAKIDGKLMAIPWTGVAKESVPVLWIRKDWFEKLNLSAPKTMDDVLNIAKAFTTQDPDGNNKDDTYGLALDKDFNMLPGFLNGFHAYRQIWIEDGSKNLVYSSIQPQMKTALEKLQEMYKNKEIDPEFGVKDQAKVEESIGAGKIGMLFGNIGSSTAPLQKLTPKTEWLPFPVPSIDSQQVKLQHPLNIFNYYWVVKKGTKHPEAMFSMIQAWLDLFYDNTSDDIYAKYNATSDTGFWMNAPVKIYKSYKNVDIYRHLKPVLESNQGDKADLSKLTPEERDWYKKILAYKNGDMSYWGIYRKSGPDSGGKVVDGYIKNDQFMPDKFTTSPTPAMVQKLPNLKKMEDQMITKIILGGSIDDFDKFVADWKKLGGDDMTKEVNDWYKNR